MFPLKLPQ
ncbi:unnamed protein product, partial [Rotaria sp. Silwood1]